MEAVLMARFRHARWNSSATATFPFDPNFAHRGGLRPDPRQPRNLDRDAIQKSVDSCGRAAC
jgi:hypothetical protein